MTGTTRAEALREALQDAVRAAVAEGAKCRSPKTPCAFCERAVAGVMNAAGLYADARLREVRELAESWTEADGWGELTAEMKIEAACGRAVLEAAGPDPAEEERKVPDE